MYRTYQSDDSDKQNLGYNKNTQERITPKKVFEGEGPEVCNSNNALAKSSNPISKIFSGIEMDDIIVIALVLLLINDGCDDYMLLLALIAIIIL